MAPLGYGAIKQLFFLSPFTHNQKFYVFVFFLSLFPFPGRACVPYEDYRCRRDVILFLVEETRRDVLVCLSGSDDVSLSLFYMLAILFYVSFLSTFCCCQCIFYLSISLFLYLSICPSNYPSFFSFLFISAFKRFISSTSFSIS